MAKNYSSITNRLCNKIKPSKYCHRENKILYIIRDSKLDPLAFIQSFSEDIRHLELIDKDETRNADFEVKSMSIEEFVDQFHHLKLVDIPTKYGSKLFKTIEPPSGKDGGVLVVYDFKDFSSFNETLSTDEQEDLVWLSLQLWDIIFLTSDTDAKNEPVCCGYLHKKGGMNLGSYITVD